MFEKDPKQVQAIVVGIEHYAYDPKWQLPGATDDALRVVQWLRRRGLEEDQIALFLSPTSWSAPGLSRWARSWPEQYEATQQVVKEFIDLQLAEKMAKKGRNALFFYWAGHGLIDVAEDKNYLLLADATRTNTYYLNLQGLFDTLKQKKFANFKQQLCIVDACATPYDEVRSAIALSEVNFTPGSMQRKDLEQCYMFAASPGALAKNDSVNRWGLFSKNLLDKLAKRRTPLSLDGFVTTFRQVRDLDILDAQRPFMTWIKGMGELEKFGRMPHQPGTAPELLALIRRHPADNARYERLYLRSLPNPTRALLQGTLESWLGHLADMPQRNMDYPSPLAEFALRLAREAGQGELETWARKICHPQQLRHLLDKLEGEEDARRVEQAVVFLELTEDKRELLWWVWSDREHLRTTPAAAALDPHQLHGSLREVLSHVFAQTYPRLAGCILRVGLILPSDALCAGLENIVFDIEVDGIPTSDSLYERHPLLFHWNRRAYLNSAFDSRGLWETTVVKLQKRISQGSGTRIHWLDHEQKRPHEAAKDQLLSGDGQAICVGFDGDPAHATALVKAVHGCLRQGIPCFFWLKETAADAAQARVELERVLGEMTAAETPLELRRKTAEAKTDSILHALRMVWDLPAQLPTLDKFQSMIPGKQT